MNRGLLLHPPTQAELERLYHELAAHGARAVGKKSPWRYRYRSLEELLALAGEMLRYDARLLTILLQFVAKHWASVNPLALRRAMAAMRWPQALCVVLSFLRDSTREPELRRFVDYVCAGWERVEPVEQFFVEGPRPGSRTAAGRMGRSLGPYTRWGFIGMERPILDPTTRRTVGRYDARTRRMILDGLAERQERFTLAEYLEAVDHAISRQQALLDLKDNDAIEVKGHGRGAHWQARPRRARRRR